MPLADSAFRLLTLRRVSLWKLPGEPRDIALLWLAALFAVKLAYPDRAYWYFDLSRPLARLGLAVLAGFLAAWLLRKGGEALRFAFALLLITAACLLLQALIDQFLPDDVLPEPWRNLLVPSLGVVLAVRFVCSASGWSLPVDKLRAGLAVALIMGTALAWNEAESALMRMAAEDRYAARPPEIDPETLWTAQPSLLGTALNRLPAREGSVPRTFVVSVAASGLQKIFGREANAAGNTLAKRFGADAGQITLSNSVDDLKRQPMANRGNLSATLADIAGKSDLQRDLVVIYLASHGNREGELSTDLPDYTQLKRISAESVAEALRKARIGRRIVVVSACYSGSWIKPLATPDTIVLTASAANRTSFGCDDERDYTVFGQAFIRRMADPQVSMRDAFASMQRDITKEEADQQAQPSKPQAFVGVNMRELWERHE